VIDLAKVHRNIVQTRAGGAVERCHVIGSRKHGSYTNSQHQWGVAMLLWHLYPEYFNALVSVALSHDVPEFVFGDAPATTKRVVPGLRDQLAALEGEYNNSIGLPAEEGLTEVEGAVVKSCDRLELWLWCREQLLMGNQFVIEFIEELERWFAEPGYLEPRAYAYWEMVRDGLGPSSNMMPTVAGVVKGAVR